MPERYGHWNSVYQTFNEARIRPHKSQYWLTSKDKREDPEKYQEDTRHGIARG